MAYRKCLIVLLLAGCATQHKPPYEAITDLVPDCANRDAQVRYLDKLRHKKAVDVDNNVYNKTINIQIERLIYYCQ